MSAGLGTIDFVPPGPVAAAFLDSRAKVSALIGPYGSAKTSTGIVTLLKCAAESNADSDGTIRFRACVVRSTYQMLISSLIPTVERILPRSVGKITLGSPIQKKIAAPGIELLIDFLALDQDADRRRIEGSTYNFLWIDEARETSWPLIQTALTRLRAMTDQGKPQPLRCIFTSNPSSKAHWLYRHFVEQPIEGWELFHQPSGLSPQAENLRFLPEGYYRDMCATSDPSFIEVHVKSQWGDVVIGEAVIPEFSPQIHVASEELVASPVLPLILGIDCGPTLNPACVIAQLIERKNGRDVIGRQLRIIDEWSASNMGAQRAAHELRAFVQRNYPEIPIEWGSVDPSAGNQRSTSSEEFFLTIWKGITRWKLKSAPSNLLSVRVESVRGMFQRILLGGEPAILISPRCTNLIRALSGEWRFKSHVTPQGLATKENEIDKLNRPYADLGDALSYLVLSSGEWETLRRLNKQKSAIAPNESAWDQSEEFFPDFSRERRRA